MNILVHTKSPGVRAAAGPADKAATSPPAPFEIALVRKLESRTSTVRGAFLLLDADGDGRIGLSDLRAVLHNELAIDLSPEQEDSLLARLGQFCQSNCEVTKRKGMGYGEFARYFYEVSSATLPSSQAGLAAAVGFQRDSDNGDGRTSSERPVHLQPRSILRQRRRQVRDLLRSHSSRTTGSGMKETSLFLKIDAHRSGRVTMTEFLDWLNATGGLGWTMDDWREVVLGEVNGDGDIVIDEERLAKRWFRGPIDGVGETGMLEHEFARFVESLDFQ